MNVENIYARSEAHAISDSRGDISRLIIFNNNAEKTVFEFIDEAVVGMGHFKAKGFVTKPTFV